MTKVVATQTGFYRGNRYRIGDVFDMDDAAVKRVGKDGKPRDPKWFKVVKSDADGAKVAAAVVKEAEEKMRAGAAAASGGKAARDKVQAIAEQISG